MRIRWHARILQRSTAFGPRTLSWQGRYWFPVRSHWNDANYTLQKNLVSTHYCFLFSKARGPSRSSAIIMRATLVSIQRSRRKLTGYTPARCFSGCKLTEHSFDLPFANESRDRQWSLRAYVVQETESGEWHSAGSVGSLYPYRFAAENSDPPLRWKSIVH